MTLVMMSKVYFILMTIINDCDDGGDIDEMGDIW